MRHGRSVRHSCGHRQGVDTLNHGRQTEGRDTVEAMKKSLRGISPRVLSERLKRLEKDGLTKREVQNTLPIRVLYRLTETGLMAAKLGEPVFLYLRYEKELYGHDHESK